MSRYSQLANNWVKHSKLKAPQLESSPQLSTANFNTVRSADKFKAFNIKHTSGLRTGDRRSESSLTKPSFMHAYDLPLPKFNLAKHYKRPHKVDMGEWQVQILGQHAKATSHRKSASMHTSEDRLELPSVHKRMASLSKEAVESEEKLTRFHGSMPKSSHKRSVKFALNKVEPVEFLPGSQTVKHTKSSYGTQTLEQHYN